MSPDYAAGALIIAAGDRCTKEDAFLLKLGYAK
jgi:hypothetical protein